MSKLLEIQDLEVFIDDKKIIDKLSLDLEKRKIHVLMGPNGSGKSTLANVLMGHPEVLVDGGNVVLEGKSILDLEPDERSQRGIFLSFQYPSEVPGVSISSFLRMIYNKKTGENLSPVKFRKFVKEKMDILGLDESFLDRYLNDGFSGGEKKKMEMLQMLVLEPKLAILDETDSGLDIDAIKTVSSVINKIHRDSDITFLLITHYSRILEYVEPDKVFVMKNGEITRTGGKELAHELEKKGYDL